VAGEQTNALPVHGDVKQIGSGANASQDCLRWDVQILENQLPDGGGAQTHFLEVLAGRESRGVAFHQESSHAAVIPLLGVGQRKHDDQIRHGSVRDKPLRPVDAEARAIDFSLGAQRESIGAGPGFRHGVNADQSAVAQPAQIALLLILGAVLPQGHNAGEEMGTQGEDQATILAPVSERLQGDRTGEGIETAAAVLGWHGQALDADLSTLAPQLTGEDLFAVAFGHALVQDLLGKPHNCLAQDALFFAEGEIHQFISFSRW
jgi:hypothetical protein